MQKHSSLMKGISATLLLIIALNFSWPPVAAAQAAAAQTAVTVTISPNTIQVGKTRDFTITTNPASDLTGFVPQPFPKDSGISFQPFQEPNKVQSPPPPPPPLFEVTKDKASVNVRIKVEESADLGMFPLRLVRPVAGQPDEVLVANLEVVEFKPRPIPRRPTPNDISRVDVMWTLLPDGVVKDNFGTKTAKHYYGIQVAVGNNTGFDLQIVTMGFDTNLGLPANEANPAPSPSPTPSPSASPSPSPSNAGQKDKQPAPESGQPAASTPQKALLTSDPARLGNFQIPAIDHKLVRGTIEKEQAYGKRALAINFVNGFGTLATGFVPFFHASNPKANYAAFTSLLNGQFKEGFGLTVPDLTVRQLNRLENNVMHDEIVVPNNSQMKTVVFVPKEIFDYPSSESEQAGRSTNNKKLKPTSREIMNKMGRLIIVGRGLEYRDFQDREVVTVRTSAPESSTSPTTATTTTGTAPVSGANGTPTITHITPSGPVTGKDLIIIDGSNFGDNPTVTFAGNPADVDKSKSNDTKIVVTLPPFTGKIPPPPDLIQNPTADPFLVQVVNVEVSNGKNSGTAKITFTYVREL